jgi:hypothetical protein
MLNKAQNTIVKASNPGAFFFHDKWVFLDLVECNKHQQLLESEYRKFEIFMEWRIL